MKQIFFLISMFSCSVLAAETNAYIGAGWREDNLTWSISGPHGHPNILSELEWKNVEMFAIKAGMNGIVNTDWYYRLDGDYGKIMKGKNVDSDYLGDNRTRIFSRSQNDGDFGEAWDVDIAIGYPFYLCSKELVLIPVIGYSRMQLNLGMRNGVQTVNVFGGFIGPFSGLKSTYKTSWSNGFLGMDFRYDPSCYCRLYGTIELLGTSYNAKGHWNLREDFLSDFKHTGNGAGIHLVFGGEWEFASCMRSGILVDYKQFLVKDGKDRTHFLLEEADSFGNISMKDAVGELPLKKVQWRSIQILGTLSYEF
jgi:hypothetical protein